MQITADENGDARWSVGLACAAPSNNARETMEYRKKPINQFLFIFFLSPIDTIHTQLSYIIRIILRDYTRK